MVHVAHEPDPRPDMGQIDRLPYDDTDHEMPAPLWVAVLEVFGGALIAVTLFPLLIVAIGLAMICGLFRKPRQ